MKIIIDTETKYYQNPALNRGLQTFTSFISSNSRFIFLEAHLDRLLMGADWLFPSHSWLEKKAEIKEFISGQFRPSTYFRMMIFEDILVFSSGQHMPKDISVNAKEALSLRTKTLIPSFVKASSYLNAEAELREANKIGFNEVLFFDSENKLCEASTSNIFVVDQKKRVFTPPVSSMVLSGTTRAMMIEFLKKNHYHIEERPIYGNELDGCEEMWLTNSVSGLRFVKKYESKNLQNELFEEVSKRFGRFGENYE